MPTKRLLQMVKVISEMEKFIALSLIDKEWKEHLRDMDDLKQSVQNAVFEQKDPLLIYKFEAVKLFERFLSRINVDTVSFLMKADMPDFQQAVEQPVVQQAPAPQPKLQTQKDEAISSLVGGLAGTLDSGLDYIDPRYSMLRKLLQDKPSKLLIAIKE
jgi:preprotein translocase subunit SecA